MTSIAAIEYPLRYVHSGSRYVRFVVNIGDSIDWAAVNSHPQLNLRPAVAGSQRLANLQRTSDRLLRAAEKKQRHSIPGRHPDQFVACFCCTKRFGVPDDPIQFLQQLNLLVDQQLRITHDVD